MEANAPGGAKTAGAVRFIVSSGNWIERGRP